MTSSHDTWLTQDAFDKVKSEVDDLTTTGRSEIAKRIEAARAEATRGHANPRRSADLLKLTLEGLAIIMGLDRLLDMFRSAVNVTGDLSCTAVVARLEGEHPGRGMKRPKKARKKKGDHEDSPKISLSDPD